ncbi:type II toxin-antitoxin system RelE/ParE family toxin [Nocardioides sp. KR10-350]|jgi:toxin ParE1/3/4|uniref:type II toxin-antitoxin system RelE/ParE family toxin n=1 Tax=Nocardioides cheoyonin TaxID=3156615 RepID=UPI0032B5F683
MSGFRVSRAAADDIGEILEWSEEHFGAAARVRYDALIRAALRHASSDRTDGRFKSRPEIGDGVKSWHLANSATQSRGERVKTPRHLLFCRDEDDLLAVGRVLHERMDPTLHVDPQTDWE